MVLSYYSILQAIECAILPLVATSAHKSGRGGWEDAERQRRQWLQQFVRAFGNDMAEESNSFDGTIPQLRRSLDRSLDAFFDLLPGAEDEDVEQFGD